MFEFASSIKRTETALTAVLNANPVILHCVLSVVLPGQWSESELLFLIVMGIPPFVLFTSKGFDRRKSRKHIY